MVTDKKMIRFFQILYIIALCSGIALLFYNYTFERLALCICIATALAFSQLYYSTLK